MLRFLSRWRARDLFLAWAAYWLALALVELTPALPAIWQATHAPGPDQGGVTLNVGSVGVKLLVTLYGKAIWEGTRTVIDLALLIGVPPLALWALWVSRRHRQPSAERVP